jgi:hypothetical protein
MASVMETHGQRDGFNECPVPERILNNGLRRGVDAAVFRPMISSSAETMPPLLFRLKLEATILL